MINNPKSPLVSIQMPCYNSRDSLPMAMASLLCQSYENWELIFVDDGSTDGSADFVKSIQDERIKVFRLERNYGRGHARQKAKDEAGGDYMAMLDSDDWYYSEKLEKQVDYLAKNINTSVVSTGMIVVDSKMDVIGHRSCKEIFEQINKGYEKCIEIAHAPSMIRSGVAKGVQYELIRGEDKDFISKILVDARYSNIPETLYVYNDRNSYDMKNVHDRYLSQKYHIENLAKLYPINKIKEQIRMTSKYIIKKTAFTLGMEKHVIKWRIKKPRREILEKFKNEQNKVLKIANDLKSL